jgi:hypothetical protein
MRPEEKIEKRFVRKVYELGCRAIKWEIAGRKGAHDRMVLIPGGEIIFVEFKRPGGKQSYHQIEFDNMITGLGFRTYLCDTWEEPLEIVITLMKGVEHVDKAIR